jgi:hypothetical protein
MSKILRRSMAAVAILVGASIALPALADDHHDRHEYREHVRHERFEHRYYRDRYAYAPGYVYAPPPVVYAPPPPPAGLNVVIPLQFR